MTRKEAFELLVKAYASDYPGDVIEPVDPGPEMISTHMLDSAVPSQVVDMRMAVSVLIRTAPEDYPLFVADSRNSWKVSVVLVAHAMQQMLAGTLTLTSRGDV
jgi:hypothetical protein